MKCPRCGSQLFDGTKCGACGKTGSDLPQTKPKNTTHVWKIVGGVIGFGTTFGGAVSRIIRRTAEGSNEEVFVQIAFGGLCVSVLFGILFEGLFALSGEGNPLTSALKGFLFGLAKGTVMGMAYATVFWGTATLLSQISESWGWTLPMFVLGAVGGATAGAVAALTALGLKIGGREMYHEAAKLKS